MRRFVRGDIDGFFGLALDNLVQLLLIDALCRHVVGLSPELVYGRVLPGAAMSILVGNLYYSRQARQLAERSGRSDVAALPYGINTVSLFAHVFLVMLPAKMAAEAAGAADPARVAWQAGLWACMGSGLIEGGGAFVAEKLRKITPRAALLSTLSGIALGFISLGFLFRTFANPVVGIVTLGLIMMVYFGRVRFKGGIPGGLLAVAVGTLLAWVTGIAPVGDPPTQGLSLHLPIPVLGDLAGSAGTMLTYLSVIVPMGLFNLIGSLQNIESAEAAGDGYPTRPSLLVNGIGSVVAAIFGSCFPTTIYIGHPGWKALGARSGYSVLNGAFVTAVCLTGSLAWIAHVVPVDAGMAIVLWIGVVITAQAFEVTPRHHAPAVVMGILPGVGAWGSLLIKNGLRAAGYGAPDKPMTEALIGALKQSDTWAHGAFALEQGFIFTAMFLSAATVELLERRPRRAAGWFLALAGASAVGVIHSYRWTPGDTVVSLTPAWGWAAGYAAVAAILLVSPWITEPTEGEGV